MSDPRPDGIVVEGENEQFQLPDGTLVGTGMLRMAGGPRETLKAFPEDLLLDDADLKKLLSRATIKEMRDRRRKRVRNQGQIGSCCPVSVVSCFEETQVRSGRPHTPLQPEHLYARINGGGDNGALLQDAMVEMVRNGCGPAGSVPPGTYSRRQQGNVAAADREGPRFKMHEPFALPTDYRTYCRALASAIARDMLAEIAWHVTSSTMRLDGRGFCRVGRGPGNHASFLHWAEWVGGEELIVPDLGNSWGPTLDKLYGPPSPGWGEDGHGRIHMPDLFATRKYHQHFIVSSIIDDPKGDNPL